MSAVIIPFPTGLSAAEVDRRVAESRRMSAKLAVSAERIAFLAGFMDAWHKAAAEPAKPPRRKRNN